MRARGYDSQFLRRLSFKVHRETSPLVGPGDQLSEHHPLVFLMRFAHRDASCFDVRPSLSADDPISIGIYPQPAVLKALFGLLAHDSAAVADNLPSLAEAMQVPLESTRAIAGIATRGVTVAENRWVSCLRFEAARRKLLSADGRHRRLGRKIGCEPSELRRHAKPLSTCLGVKSVYLSSFMAGCSEDADFLTEALTPLAIKLKISVDLVVDLVRAAQRDRSALRNVATRVLDSPSVRYVVKNDVNAVASRTRRVSRRVVRCARAQVEHTVSRGAMRKSDPRLSQRRAHASLARPPCSRRLGPTSRGGGVDFRRRRDLALCRRTPREIRRSRLSQLGQAAAPFFYLQETSRLSSSS